MHEPRARTNRLRRSVRASQAAPGSLSSGDRPRHGPQQHRDPQNQVQTPLRSRLSAGASGESPHNDSDLNQDIVWDNTSPSPHRPGKRGRKVAVGLVNISDIVNRIAPESGRPRVLEPTLQQWIGDSATIPCTPELQPPKVKRKSPRPNAVDDLLRLAKQFDFNMLHETHQDQDLDLALDPPRPRDPTPVPDPDWLSDEDLDFLFDSSTQSVSGAFSQNLVTMKTPHNPEKSQRRQTDQDQAKSNTKPAPHNSTKSFSNTRNQPRAKPRYSSDEKALDRPADQTEPHQVKSFKFKSLNSSSSSAPYLPENNAPVQDLDLDDWGDDGLMDSLLMEITQNPLDFTTSPKCTSTQRNNENRSRRSLALNVNSHFYTNRSTSEDLDFRETSEDDAELVQTSKLFFKNSQMPQTSATSNCFQESFHRAGAGLILSLQSGDDKSSSHVFTDHSAAGFHGNSTTTTNKFASVSGAGPTGFMRRSDGSRTVDVPHNYRANVHNSFTLKVSQNIPATNNREVSSKSCSSFRNSAVDQDLNSFTARCDTKCSKNNRFNTKKNFTNASDSAHVVSLARKPYEDFLDEDLDSIFASEPLWNNEADDDLLCELCDDVETQIQHTANQRQGAGLGADATWHRSKVALGQFDRRGIQNQDDFTFKRPVSPGPRVISKCSAAEIELKKQQALERRRQRRQANQPISSQQTFNRPIRSLQNSNRPISSV